jgi:hypothetical protein
MSTPIRCLALCALCAAPPVAAATYSVGPNGEFATLNALFAARDLEPGDIVEVEGGVTYDGDIVVPAADGGAPGNPVILRGVGDPRPHLSGGFNTIEFRFSDHMVMERFEISGSVADNTFRCVYHHAHDIVLRDLLVRDCPRHGVLGADQGSGSLTIEYSELRNAGSGGGNHLVYMATDEVAFPGAVFRLQYSYLHDSDFNDGAAGTVGGNLIKSRAERNEIYYNWLEGAYYHELELIGPDPGGAPPGWSEGLVREDSDIVGNVILHTEPFGAIMRFGGDATGQTHGRYRFVNNTVVRVGGSTDSPTSAFRLFDGIAAVEIHNNVFHRIGVPALRLYRRDIVSPGVVGDPIIGGSANWITSGSTAIPAAWTGTLQGADPGFENAAGFDFRPAAGSPLLHAGLAFPSAGPAFSIAQALFPPRRHAPARQWIAVGTAPFRPEFAAIDIGVFEREDPDRVFGNGFEG